MDEKNQTKTNSSKKIRIIKASIILIVSLALIFFSRLIIEKVRAYPNSILRFSPASRTVGLNQDFTLDAMIDPRTNQVSAVELHITFDQTRFQLSNISTIGSPFTATLQAASINNTNGTASIVVGVPTANPPVPVTATAKIATFTFHSISGVSNSSIIFTATSQAAAFGETADVITQRDPAIVTVDATAPTGGSISYTNGYYRATSVALTTSDGTDSQSGINTATRFVSRRSATLSDTACGTFGSWINITPTGAYPSYTDSTVATGNCYQYRFLISDNAGNQAAYESPNIARIDTATPTIGQVTAVPSPTSSRNPSYTFSSTEAGTIAYGGSCGSATTAAVAGNNTISFNTLSSGTYSNCTIRVTDTAGNQSSSLAVNTFTIDATLPTVTNVISTTADGTYGTGSVINITVTFSEAVTSSGNVSVTLDTGRSCTFSISNSNSRSCNYTVQNGDSSSDLTTTSISGTISDQVGNAMTNFAPATNLSANKNIVINAVAPALTQVTAIPVVTSDSTPNYTFSSNKAGMITYTGDCNSATTAAIAGNNAITFNALTLGSHSNCTITVTDSTSNASTPLSVGSFAVTYRGDLNLDRRVDIFDYNTLVTNFGSTTCDNTADIDKNCLVNIFDYSFLLEDFGRSF
jgi:large repetitive protein